MTSTEIAPLPPRRRPTGLCVEATDKEPHHAFYSSLQFTATLALLRMAHWYPMDLQFEFEFDWARLNSGRRRLWLLTMESPSLNRQESANAAGVGI